MDICSQYFFFLSAFHSCVFFYALKKTVEKNVPKIEHFLSDFLARDPE